MRMLLLVGLLAGCAGQTLPPEPIVRTVEVQVPVPVPCPALQALGPEPAVPTNAEIAAAPNIFVRTQLLVQRDLIRGARLEQYRAAKASCL